MFGKKKQEKPLEYDREYKRPAIKTSICTGEMVAGFLDKSSGKFEDVRMVQDEREIEVFCKSCGISRDEIVKIW